ncbi:MAG: glycosyltransferase [Deltaproteobacteria bacterium]|nr:glycosyltransferase [Deltaproteobacteria bacterium]
MPSSKIKLSVIVLFYHGGRWIESLMHSLENQSLSRHLYEIIIVDNGGSTPSVDRYKEQKNVQVLHFSMNYGFAGGNNKALNYAQGDIILLMNQDIVVHFNCLEEILNAFDNNPDAGAISANMSMVSSANDIDRFSYSLKKAGFYTLSPFGYASYRVIKTERDFVSVVFVSGNGLGFRKKIIRDLDGYLFDSKLGSYMEDLDLSIRLKDAGRKMYVWRKALIFHYRDDAFSGKPSQMLRKLIHISSNRLIVYLNRLSTMDYLKKLPFLLLGIPLKVARKDGGKNFNLFRFMVAFGFTPFIFIYSWFKFFITWGNDMNDGVLRTIDEPYLPNDDVVKR